MQISGIISLYVAVLPLKTGYKLYLLLAAVLEDFLPCILKSIENSHPRLLNSVLISGLKARDALGLAESNMYRVSIELLKHEWKFSRMRNAVRTRTAGKCLHSFFEFS